MQQATSGTPAPPSPLLAPAAAAAPPTLVPSAHPMKSQVPPPRHRRNSDLDRILQIVHGTFTDGEDSLLGTPSSAPGPAPVTAPLMHSAASRGILGVGAAASGVGAGTPSESGQLQQEEFVSRGIDNARKATSTVASPATATVTATVAATATATGPVIPVVATATAPAAAAAPMNAASAGGGGLGGGSLGWGPSGGGRREGAGEQWQGQAALEAELVSAHPPAVAATFQVAVSRRVTSTCTVTGTCAIAATCMAATCKPWAAWPSSGEWIAFVTHVVTLLPPLP